MPDKNLRIHWNSVYVKSPNEKPGWFEEDPELSLHLCEKCSGLPVFQYNANMLLNDQGSSLK